MAQQLGLNVATSLVLIGLLGAAAPGTALAENAASHASGSRASKASAPAGDTHVSTGAQDRGSRGAKESGRSEGRDSAATARGTGVKSGASDRQGATAKDTNTSPTSPAHAGEANPIDATLPPGRPRGPSEKASTLKPAAIVHAPTRTLPAPSAPPAKAPQEERRNAIGMAVVRQASGHPAAPDGGRTVTQGGPAAAVSTKIGLGAPRPGSLAARTGPAAGALGIGAAPLNRGAINGTSFARPGAHASAIGGGAKTAAGISGSAVRLKH